MKSNMSKRQALIFGDGPLKKAAIIFLDSKGKAKSTLPVQFNPENYSISRGIEYKSNNGIGQEDHPANMQPERGKLAKLSVSIYIDSSTELQEFVMPKQFEKHVTEKAELSEICKMLGKLTKYNHEMHLPESIVFSWGNMQFQGNATQVNINYEMFNREGKPVRAKIDMTIEGEEKDILKEIKANPNESPDRTKYRALGPLDELWMLAYDEYDDSSAWKEIARENEILNPRKIDYTKKWKVPSI